MSSSLHRLLHSIALLILPTLLYAQSANYIEIKDGQFYMPTTHQIYSIKGMSMWYAPLKSTKEKQTISQKRLIGELDSLKSIDTNTLTILAGAELGKKEINHTKDSTSTTEITLQAFSESKTMFQGLDYCLKELHNRGMRAIVNLSPYWNLDAKFNKDYQTFARSIIKHYQNNETILSWQLCDAPYIIDKQTYHAYTQWCEEMSDSIKKEDTHHLVNAVYAPLSKDSSKEFNTFRQLTSKGNIDFYVVDLSPYKQNWVNRGNLFDGLANIYILTDELLQSYNRALQNSGKPFIIQVAYPRDGGYTGAETSTDARNEYLTYISSALNNTHSTTRALQGIVVNGWGGNVEVQNGNKQAFKNILTEYPQEKKGQYFIYITDHETTRIIRQIFSE